MGGDIFRSCNYGDVNRKTTGEYVIRGKGAWLFLPIQSPERYRYS